MVTLDRVHPTLLDGRIDDHFGERSRYGQARAVCARRRSRWHKHNKQVMYHTDGAVRPLIPDLIEVGVDVLNPIQPGAVHGGRRME